MLKPYHSFLTRVLMSFSWLSSSISQLLKAYKWTNKIWKTTKDADSFFLKMKNGCLNLHKTHFTPWSCPPNVKKTHQIEYFVLCTPIMSLWIRGFPKQDLTDFVSWSWSFSRQLSTQCVQCDLALQLRWIVYVCILGRLKCDWILYPLLSLCSKPSKIPVGWEQTRSQGEAHFRGQTLQLRCALGVLIDGTV